ncbi:MULTISPECIES: helix-turn-helix transcriptional regulator [Bacillati]|uniref:XRE family transcriptional regulator n=1 Tax=Staphylococcus warneri TaxID=1292 RepID=A0AB36BH46_STAWA|nr:helix-turn-helix transcriptional regulator [Staphylococcus warneri]MCC8990360.1 helix-turn-helix domain-containing protein [Staphylococcus sp.]MCR1798342.1 helix-turn-helix domain-containing protein [Staphylococcus warneri]NBH30569.1 XRE family transcriptional regulator [Staphylococcus warneri]
MFSQNLKYLREKHDMEQLDLAKALGRKSASSISEWEKGKYTPKMKTLNEIAKLFKVNIDDLMTKDLKNSIENKEEIVAAHLDYSDLTEEEQKEIEQFIEFVRNRKK